jgi:hypothetical protein
VVLDREGIVSDFDCPRCGETEYDGPDSEGSHDWVCDDCGFAFTVNAELATIYDIECVEHKSGEWEDYPGESLQIRTCEYCGKTEIREAE